MIGVFRGNGDVVLINIFSVPGVGWIVDNWRFILVGDAAIKIDNILGMTPSMV